MNMLELEETSGSTPGLDIAKKTLEDLYTKYSGDAQIFAKMHNYVCFRLPSVIEEMKRTSDERRIRNEFLSTEQDAFIHAFLNDHRYFYCPQTDIFFYYDGEHYSTRKEDVVLHHILTSITKECNALIPRKPQTKVYIMKRVKESNPLKSIPESITIQSVLDSLYPAIFHTKSAAKYFLTILGDHLLKKTDDSLQAYFTTNKAREFLREISQISQTLFGVNAVSSFKYKYHYHAYKTIRMVKINDAVAAETVWRSILQFKSIDLFCVAAHYSSRYESADQYLDMYSDDAELSKYALYFRWKTGKEVIDDFISEYLCVVEHIATTNSLAPSSLASLQDPLPSDTVANTNTKSSKITAATMEYLWKKYLKDKQFPAVAIENGWFAAIVEALPGKYDEDKNIFVGISSSHLHTIDKFHKFWEECITICKDSEKDNLAEYEIGEMAMMYKEWCGTGGSARINDAQMLDLIRFYKDVEIIDNKYIQNIRCKLWDKAGELQRFFSELKSSLESGDLDQFELVGAQLKYAYPYALMSFYDAYTIYNTKWRVTIENGKKKTRSNVISKTYFDNYIYEMLGDFASDGKLNLDHWLNRTI